MILQCARSDSKGGLSGFLNSWDSILQGMREPPNETQLEFIFYEAIRLHPDVKEDIAHYDRLEEGAGGDRSYEFLYNCVCRAVRVKRMRENLYQQRKNIGDLPDVGNPNEDTRYMSSPNCTAPTNQQEAGKKRTLCAYHLQGFCNKGDKCKYSHDLRDVPEELRRRFEIEPTETERSEGFETVSYTHLTLPTILRV